MIMTTDQERLLLTQVQRITDQQGDFHRRMLNMAIELEKLQDDLRILKARMNGY